MHQKEGQRCRASRVVASPSPQTTELRSAVPGGKGIEGMRGGAIRLLAVAALAAMAAGCATGGAPTPLPASATAPWEPPPELAPEPQPIPHRTDIPVELLKPGTTVDLPTVIDLALQNSPQTRETWAAARSAAEEVGSRRSAYYPQLEADAQIERTRQSAVGNRFTFQLTQYGPSLDLSYLLFSFGGRKADVEQAREQLVSADWQHNARIQAVVLQVTQAFYAYEGQKALLEAAKADLESAEKNLQAAQDRHEAGVATIADVLQAKTARAQAQLAVQQVHGELAVTRGSLATAIGVSPNVPVDAGELPEDVPIHALSTSIEELLGRALGSRPDLAAARADAKAAEAKVAKTRADGLPKVSLQASTSRVYYDIPGSAPSQNFSGALTVSYPLFTGFKNFHDLEKAKADADNARARVDDLSQQVMLQVWTSYYALETASEQVATSRDFLASAGQSADVAAGRYKAGVGSVLDLLSAQSALASARAQEVQARANWFLTLTQLARDTGLLGNLGPQALAETISHGDAPNHESH